MNLKITLGFAVTTIFGFCNNYVIWYCEKSKSGMNDMGEAEKKIWFPGPFIFLCVYSL